MNTTIRKVLGFSLIILLLLSFPEVASARNKALSGKRHGDQGCMDGGEEQIH